MELCIREQLEKNEHLYLSEHAAFSDQSRGRERPEKPCDLRTDYQRDTDRIVHSNAFRRLKHKTQVFLSPEGDHYITRLTHTLQVSQIARTMARALRLNENLTEAIALGHDVGHTPFGHAGEWALNDVYPGGFKHYEHSARVLQRLEKNGRGLNLTAEVLDGIRTHTKGTEAVTLEGRLVRLADRIAYVNHDIEDAVRAGIIREDDLPIDIREALGNSKSQRITTLVKSVINNVLTKGIVAVGEDIAPMFDTLHNFMFANIYTNSKAKTEETKAAEMVRMLYRYFTEHYDKLPKEYRYIGDRDGEEQAVVDYIAGMSDQYAVTVFESIYVPRAWSEAP